MILGLESIPALEEVLASADTVRDEFRKNCHFPLIFWVNDDTKTKLMQLAPNLESWGTSTEFTISYEELADFINGKAEQFFTSKLLRFSLLELEAELTAAQVDLYSNKPDLAPELSANLESLLGFIREIKGNRTAACQHYQRAVQLWQEVGNLERQGQILSYLASCADEQGARDYLQQAVSIFEQIGRKDLIADSMVRFSQVLKQLEDWQLLENLARKALEVHQATNQSIPLAQDYGFLAEVALNQERWQEAQQFAFTALEVDTELENDLESWLRFLWARSQQHLDQEQEAIENLEIAKLGYPLYDLQLHLDILGDLQKLYFQHRDYLKAFQIKQERQRVETQFGLRAFIGASRIQPTIGAQGVAPSPAPKFTSLPNNSEPIAPEIIASGREKDVRELVARLQRTDYKVVVLYGYSGVGKSSLVNAGLVPTLQKSTVSGQAIAPILIRVYTDWRKELAEVLGITPPQTPPLQGYRVHTSLDQPQDPAFSPPSPPTLGGTGVQSPPGLGDLGGSKGLDIIQSDLCIHRSLQGEGLSNSPFPRLSNSPFPTREGGWGVRSSNSQATILAKLKQAEAQNRRIVLIFDQFEEFFFVNDGKCSSHQQWENEFFAFLGDCLQILSLKVVFSLRQDYLHL
ncbi:MAG: hypothetical protein WA919_28620 [Coleofasciculaceae cyanobacterium]